MGELSLARGEKVEECTTESHGQRADHEVRVSHLSTRRRQSAWPVNELSKGGGQWDIQH